MYGVFDVPLAVGLASPARIVIQAAVLAAVLDLMTGEET
jgi:hypothetical protein